MVGKAIKEKGCLIIATFSTDGPIKCSGLEVQQYNEETRSALFQNDFEKIHCTREDHITPFNKSKIFYSAYSGDAKARQMLLLLH